MLERFETDFRDYADYPFDQLSFNWRFEMSHFTLPFEKKKIEYRFDFYEQSDNSIAYKDDFDNSPELDINYS